MGKLMHGMLQVECSFYPQTNSFSPNKVLLLFLDHSADFPPKWTCDDNPRWHSECLGAPKILTWHWEQTNGAISRTLDSALNLFAIKRHSHY